MSSRHQGGREDPERVKERVRRWREQNPEKYREQNRRTYQANREKILARARAQGEQKRRERLELIQAAKDQPCVDCGKQFEPAKMHFDHRPDEEKLFNVSDVGTRSLEAIETEIAKCDVRCASCHARRHAEAA